MSGRGGVFGGLREGVGYEELSRGFRWRIPDAFNMGAACVETRDPAATALVVQGDSGDARRHTFGELERGSAALANVLEGAGVRRGDRVAICLPQGLEAGLAYLAAFRMGAVAVPIAELFGTDAIRYRLAHSGAAALIIDPSGAEKLEEARDEVGELRALLVTGEWPLPPAPGAAGFDDALASASESFATVETAAEDPALLMYTSGTTRDPKGALHAHRFLFGSFPAVELAHWPLPTEGDLFWTPAGWSWVAALMDIVLPAWYFGVPVLATPRGKFDPEWVLRTMSEHRVANAYLPPTALKMLRRAGGPAELPSLRSVMTGGEALGSELLGWGREALGVTIEETYGQTEANLTVGNASRFWPVREGSMGRPYPGHEVQVHREDGSEADPGQMGEIVVRRPNPAMFLEYHDAGEWTREAFRGEWLRSGDFGQRDEEGYLWFDGRRDDIINSAGHRIGPVEIEECLLRHPSVGVAAVIGVPDPDRGEVVKAFIVLREHVRPSPELEEDLRGFVKRRHGAHKYPRLMEFVDELPLTTTGKLRRRDLREREARRG